MQKSGNSNVPYGLIWNRTSDDDYLSFKVTLDGMYRIDGKKEGKGTIHWIDGTTFTGDFRNDKIEGNGTY